MAEDVPDEVIVEILSRLPVESIMRFKCVCRTWYALFQNPKFVARHLANQSMDHILLKSVCFQNDAGTVLNVISDVNDPDPDDAVDLYLNPNKEPFTIVGHCDGIIALMGIQRDCDVMVCNPGIREFRTLPKSSFHTFYENKVYTPHRTLAVGFGYDHKTNDYKVVKVVGFGKYKIPSRFEVFSLRSDSSWRQVKNVAAEATISFSIEDEGMQYFDGTFYWWGTDYEEMLLSFDMADEVFRKSPLPYICDNDFFEEIVSSKHIGVYNNESISLFVYPTTYELQIEKCIDVWVLKEFGVKESWTKQFTIGPLLGLYRPIVFWKNDELVILQEDANGQLFCYDPVTLESKRLPFCGVNFEGFAIAYMKTIVSVNKREDIVI